MRDIIFRGKRCDDGQWIYGSLNTFDVHYQALSGRMVDRFEAYIHAHPDSKPWNESVEEVNPETVGQYTGVLDKDGNKIFEGDVIERKQCGGYVIGLVNFADGCFCVRTDKYHNPAIDVFMVESETTVVGNPYDNPELVVTSE